jgi:hypothetical protein
MGCAGRNHVLHSWMLLQVCYTGYITQVLVALLIFFHVQWDHRNPWHRHHKGRRSPGTGLEKRNARSINPDSAGPRT